MTIDAWFLTVPSLVPSASAISRDIGVVILTSSANGADPQGEALSEWLVQR